MRTPPSWEEKLVVQDGDGLGLKECLWANKQLLFSTPPKNSWRTEIETKLKNRQHNMILSIECHGRNFSDIVHSQGYKLN